LPALSGPKIDLDVVELDIFGVVGRSGAGGGFRRDFGDAWTLVDSALGFFEDGAGKFIQIAIYPKGGTFFSTRHTIVYNGKCI
jgi:hypothetical protein